MSEYRVLARKYRPQRLNDLIGQDALVRTLGNAFESGRISHGFLLTGIRGVGKTTTARIIARSLNCLGEDGNLTQPTTEPCGVCANCVQIAEDRHVDVLERDAASQTGVEATREMIETVHYRPTSARYKVYIIDEVHMLSNAAFNALLKTLEEPPPHVIFIFATTEIRKIPVTILSRCQRFDLKRVDIETLSAHLKNVCARESIEAEEEALKLVAIAAEGSVRDSLSLLDQAIAHSGSSPISADTVRNMLGVADRSRLFALLETAFGGQTNEALALVTEHYQNGGDVILLLQELLSMVHITSRLALAPKDDLGPSFSEHEKKSASSLAEKLDIPTLSLAWQLILKGLDEAKRSPDPLAAAEMVIIRLTHASSLPRPADLIREAQKQPQQSFHVPSSAPRSSASAPSSPPVSGNTAIKMEPAPSTSFEPVASAEPALALVANNPLTEIGTFEELLKLVEQKREPTLMHELVTHIRLVSFEDGAVSYTQNPALSHGFAKELGAFLKRHTGKDWKISSVAEAGKPSVAERKKAAYEKARAEAEAHPLVQDVLNMFPGARVTAFTMEE